MMNPEVPHVLVVEAGTDLRDRAQRSARSAIRCSSAKGLQDAVAAAKQRSFDVALLDVSDLPRRAGLSLMKQLQEQTPDLAIVVVAGSHGADIAADAMRFGVIDYLLKPVSSRELANALERGIAWRSSALRSATDLVGLEREMALRAVEIGCMFADSGVASSEAVDAQLVTLYGTDPVLEHVRRVAGVSVVIAASLGIGEPMLGHIERAALLHDIGKLAVPPAIVRKPEPLTVKEHDLLRGHVSVAFVALMVTPFLAPAGEIVLATRERFDGKGYPRGLSKTDIPLGARIIAVSEVFDTLICTRPPFDPRAVRAANAQLARAAGSHFDPQVVRAWLRCGDNLGELGDRRMQC